MPQTEEARHSSAKTFVDPKVQTIPVTEAIVGKIYAAFPLSAKVISGYLSEEQLYWKVNYHWEVLLEAVNHCAGLDIAQEHKNRLAAVRKSLESNLPDPASGYRKSTKPGQPKDKSSHEVILARHTLVRKGKLELKAVIEAAEVFKKTKRDPKALMLAYAPVARPAQGKHATGYALDIKGNNADIAAIAKKLGATLVFNEGSHVHCEWKDGVDDSGRSGQDSVLSAQRGAKQAIDSRIVSQRHCLLRTA